MMTVKRVKTPFFPVFVADPQTAISPTGWRAGVPAQYPSQYPPDVPTERNSAWAPAWNLRGTSSVSAPSRLTLSGPQRPQCHPCNLTHGCLRYDHNRSQTLQLKPKRQGNRLIEKLHSSLNLSLLTLSLEFLGLICVRHL